MLSERYSYDGRATLRLNPLQLEMKERIEAKVAQGVYRFAAAPCALCSGRELETLAEKDRYGLYLPVAICRGCGLIQTNPRMTRASYAEFYEQEYRPLYHGREAAEHLPSFFVEQYRKGRGIYRYLEAKLPRLFADPSRLKVLEVGCAAGGILAFFRERGCRVIGLDVAGGYLEYGRRSWGLDLRQGSLDQLPGEEGELEVVLYADVFEHLLDPAAELSLLRRLLAAEGVLYIGLPGVKNLFRSYDMDFLRLLQNAHVFHFTLRTLSDLLAVHGFELVAGNERVESVFRPRRGSGEPGIAGDYRQVMPYLRRLERLRRLLPIAPYRLGPRHLLAALLQGLGLFAPARRLYWRLQGEAFPSRAAPARRGTPPQEGPPPPE